MVNLEEKKLTISPYNFGEDTFFLERPVVKEWSGLPRIYYVKVSNKSETKKNWP